MFLKETVGPNSLHYSELSELGKKKLDFKFIEDKLNISLFGVIESPKSVMVVKT